MVDHLLWYHHGAAGLHIHGGKDGGAQCGAAGWGVRPPPLRGGSGIPGSVAAGGRRRAFDLEKMVEGDALSTDAGAAGVNGDFLEGVNLGEVVYRGVDHHDAVLLFVVVAESGPRHEVEHAGVLHVGEKRLIVHVAICVQVGVTHAVRLGVAVIGGVGGDLTGCGGCRAGIHGGDCSAATGEVYNNAMVRLIITGGTFDKQYDAIRGELTFQRTHLPEILETVGCTVPVSVEINQLIDSLEMGDADREKVVAACRAAAEDRIVITHGTDTMTVTAERLAEQDAGKTIVLTGAMVPFTVTGSDALFNLGGALLAVQTLPPGVYIVMHGRTFVAGQVYKDRTAGRFVDST